MPEKFETDVEHREGEPKEPQSYLYCECGDNGPCGLRLLRPESEIQEIEPGTIVILDGCRIGPGSDNELIETREGYKIYI